MDFSSLAETLNQTLSAAATYIHTYIHTFWLKPPTGYGSVVPQAPRASFGPRVLRLAQQPCLMTPYLNMFISLPLPPSFPPPMPPFSSYEFSFQLFVLASWPYTP